jgi:hypothetical protein
MEGMKVELFCKFESDLAVLVNWIRPSQKSLAENMTTFEPKDPKSFQVVQEPSSGHPVMGETLIIEKRSWRILDSTFVSDKQTVE